MLVDSSAPFATFKYIDLKHAKSVTNSIAKNALVLLNLVIIKRSALHVKLISKQET
jgi:hypothetical protein